MDFKLQFISLWRKTLASNFHLGNKEGIFCALLGHPAMMHTEVSHAVHDMALITEPNSILIFKSNFILRTNEVYIYGLHCYLLVITLNSFVQTAVHTTKYIKDHIRHKSRFSSDF